MKLEVARHPIPTHRSTRPAPPRPRPPPLANISEPASSVRPQLVYRPLIKFQPSIQSGRGENLNPDPSPTPPTHRLHPRSLPPPQPSFFQPQLQMCAASPLNRSGPITTKGLPIGRCAPCPSTALLSRPCASQSLRRFPLHLGLPFPTPPFT